MEPELIGSWVQTNAYLLNDIKNTLTKIVDDGKTINITVSPADVIVNPTPITINPTPITVEPTPVTITLEQNIMLPRETKFIHIPLPILQPTNNVRYEVHRNYIKPEPRIIDVSKINAYSRCCGEAYSNNSKFTNCHRCVDKWLEAHKDGFELKYLTSSGTGCKVGMPWIK